MQKLFILLSILFATARLSAHGDHALYLHAQLGGQTLGMELELFGDTYFARYFTAGSLSDRVMQGRMAEDSILHLVLREHGTDSTSAAARVSLTELQDGSWRGSWTAAGSTAESILLVPIGGAQEETLEDGRAIGLSNRPDNGQDLSPDDIPHADAFAPGQSPYALLRLSHILTTSGAEIDAGHGISICQYSDPQSGIGLFSIAGTTEPSDSINALLRAIFLAELDAYYGCATTEGKGRYTSSYCINFISPQLLHLSTSVRSSCYGGDTLSVTEQHCLDMITAAPVALEDLLWLSSDPRNSISIGQQEWYEYRYTQFAPRMLALLASQHPAEMDSSARCPLAAERYWQFPEWKLTAEGFSFMATNYYSDTCRSPWLLIPFTQLQGGLSKTYFAP